MTVISQIEKSLDVVRLKEKLVYLHKIIYVRYKSGRIEWNKPNYARYGIEFHFVCVGLEEGQELW